jgi:putative ABC transport system permease protein
MLRNYLTIAGRTLWKHKGHTIINSVGLALGLAACVLLALYVRQETSYDTFHEKADRIVQVLDVTTREDGATDRLALTSVPMAEPLRTQMPQIERLVRLSEKTGVVRVDDTSWETDVLFAGAAFFETFSFPLVQGTPSDVLSAPNAAVLTTEKARTYFGTTDVVGRRLPVRVNGTFYDFTVAGVAESAPHASSLPLGVVLPFAKLEQIDRVYQNPNWRTKAPLLFAELTRADQADALAAQLPRFVEENVPEETAQNMSLELLPLTDVHLTPDVYGQLVPPSRPLYAYILGGIAAFILLIACINFVTLASGRSAGRSKEIGVRKTMGAGRGQIMAQFWGEALLLCGGALVAGLGLARLALPVFNGLVDAQLSMATLLQPEMGLVLLGLGVVVGCAAGAYPAVALSRFDPITVLRGRSERSGSPRLVQGLVVVQFVLSTGLIIGTAAMWQQMDLLQSKELGFQQEHVVHVDASLARGASKPLVERVRQATTSSSAIQHATALWSTVGTEDALPNRFPTSSGEQQIRAHALRGSYDLVETLDLTLTQGRSFSPDRGGDAQGKNVLVNEALVRAFGWENPIGKPISVQFHAPKATVVGVVQDFHFQTLHQPIEPLVIHMRPIAPANQIYARIAPGQTEAALDQLQTVWAETVPDLPFSVSFVDAVVEQQYRAEQQWTQIVTYAAGFAIFIAGLGLFGLATLAAQRRTKEIGIRKSLGATPQQMAVLLSKDFLKPVSLAVVVAIPVAYLAIREWLNIFAYRVELGPALFVGTSVLAVLIAAGTVSVQALRAARIDPAQTLRDE